MSDALSSLIHALRLYYSWRPFYRFVAAWAVTLPIGMLITWAVTRG